MVCVYVCVCVRVYVHAHVCVKYHQTAVEVEMTQLI